MPKRDTPNGYLSQIRRHLVEMKDQCETGITDPGYIYEEIVELFTALDEAAKAGNLPDEWRPKA